jgi:predicted permease
LVSLTPVMAGFATGHVLRRGGLAGGKEGSFLFLLNLYVCMPALLLRALLEVELRRDLAVFPLAAAATVSTGFVVGALLLRLRPRPSAEAAVVVMTLMVVNVAFALPFVEALYGAPGVARLAVFDVVNNMLVLTAVWTVARRGSPRWQGGLPVLHVLRTPPFHAVVLGMVLNLARLDLPAACAAVVNTFAAASPFLIAVGTGLLFQPTRARLAQAHRLALARTSVGMGVAMLVALLADLDGVDLGVLLLLGAAPIGFVTVTFATIEELDVDLATQALTWSLVLGFVLSMGVGLLAA